MMRRVTNLYIVKSMFIGLFFFLGLSLNGQEEIIEIKNGSFEDVPHRGDFLGGGIISWYDCGKVDFPNETPPDIHPKDFWENTTPPSDGKTYLGMVARRNETYESVSQRLTTPLRGGSCYSLSIDLCQSPRYVSASRDLNGKMDSGKTNFTKPIVLRLWGGSGYCDQRQLLAESTPISHSDWKTYAFNFKTSKEFRHITVEAFYKTPVLLPYNGHLLIDNLSDIRMIDCPDEEFAGIAYPEKQEVIAAVIPPHKRTSKKPKKTKTTKKEESKSSTVASVSGPKPSKASPTVTKAKPSAKKRILAELDRKSIKKGQTINIEKLFFQADTSAINDDSYPVLEEVYGFLNENRDVIVEIGGHTNNIPDHAYCDKLSMQRAREVANFLVNKGIPLDRVKYKGYGKRKPLVSNKTAMGRKRNQRVEIKILSMDS